MGRILKKRTKETQQKFYTYNRITDPRPVNVFRHVGHFLVLLIAKLIHDAQKIWPQNVLLNVVVSSGSPKHIAQWKTDEREVEGGAVVAGVVIGVVVVEEAVAEEGNAGCNGGGTGAFSWVFFDVGFDFDFGFDDAVKTEDRRAKSKWR